MKSKYLVLVILVLNVNLTFGQSDRLFGIAWDSLNLTSIVLYDVETNTSEMVYPLYAGQGSFHPICESASDPFNERYFFCGYWDSTSYQIMQYDIASGVLSSVFSSNSFIQIDFDPFANQLLILTEGTLKGLSLNTGEIVNLVINIQPQDGTYYMFTHSFDPINQLYFITNASSLDVSTDVVADITNGLILSSVDSDSHLTSLHLYDYVTEKNYAIGPSSLPDNVGFLSLDMYTGGSNEVLSIAGNWGLLNFNTPTINHDDGIFYLPFYNFDSSQNYLFKINLNSSSVIEITPFFNLDIPQAFTGTKPAIRVSENELTCVYAEGYQWYLNNSLIPGATSQTYTANESGNYKVLATFLNGRYEFSNIAHISFASSIELESDRDIVSLQTNPNPFNDFSIIDLSKLNGSIYDVKVFNSLGKIIYKQENISSKTVELEKVKLEKGLLFFQVLTDNKIVGDGKFIVE